MFPLISDIAVIVGIFSSIVAIVGLISELRSSRLSLQTQTLLDLEERFYSPEMKALRQAAARKILAGSMVNSELEDVLDFLHSVVMLIKRKVIDKKLAFEFYKYWIARYWLSAKEYIRLVRELDDPYTYTQFQKLAEEIIKKNPEINYSPEAMQAFLLKEAGIEEVPPVRKMEPFETERLLIRPFTIEDLHALYNMYDQEELMLFIDGSVRSMSVTKKYIKSYLVDYERYGFGLCAVILKETGQIIGRCGLIPTPTDQGMEGEIAFLFKKDYWGRGLATEFSREMLRYAFEKLGLKRVFGTASPENKAAIRVMEKVGMQPVKSADGDLVFEMTREK